MTKERLLDFAEAWSCGDLNKVMQFFEEDCIYQPSVANNIGERYLGKVAVRKAIEYMMKYDDTVSSSVRNIQIFGEVGLWEWDYFTKDKKHIQGCDVFRFKDDYILEKNAYRKIVNSKGKNGD